MAATFTSILGTGAAARSSTRDAFQCVQQGIADFARGDFEAAAEQFRRAATTAPGNHRVLFNRACAEAARGNQQQAITWFREAALTKDRKLQSQCHYNLGCVAAEMAKAVLGTDPLEAKLPLRVESLKLAEQAIVHYRDCLQINQHHQSARHNLELLRKWTGHIRDQWAQRDRQRRREQMELLPFLEFIVSQQNALRESGRRQRDTADSPLRQQTLQELEVRQVELAAEIPALNAKLQAAIQETRGEEQGEEQGRQFPTEQSLRAAQAMTELAEAARKWMLDAAGRLHENEVAAATRSQAEVLDSLNDLYVVIATFTDVFRKSLVRQQELVDTSGDVARAIDLVVLEKQTDVDYEELERIQRLVHGWSRVLGWKAEAELDLLESQMTGAAPTPDEPSLAVQHKNLADQMRVQCYQRAIELAPRIESLTKQSADDLAQRDAAAALPKQEEALKLLKEIAKRMPQQPIQPRGGNDAGQGGQDDSNRRDDSPEQPATPDNAPQFTSQPPRSPPLGQPQDLTKKEAEMVLRRVRERERDYREAQKKIQIYLRGAARVDKDW